MPNWRKVITSGSDAVLATTTTNELTITGVVNAGVDTDKFLVLDSSNNVDFRTGAQVLSDIGGGGGSSVWTTDTNGDTILGSSNQIGNVSITNQQNLSTGTGTTTIASVLIASYDAVFIDFVIKKGTNIRSGTVYACHDGTNVEFTETSTNDLGDTTDVDLVVNISGTALRLQAVIAASTWEIKTFIRAL